MPLVVDVQGGTNVLLSLRSWVFSAQLANVAVMFALVVGLCQATNAADSVLIEFSSSRCRPCQQMKPVLQALQQNGVAIRSVDVDRESELAQRYQVRETPTYVIVAGGKEVSRLVGMQTAEALWTALSVSPNGPWVQTNTKPVESTPLTRLAPLATAPQPSAAERNQLASIQPASSTGDRLSEVMPSTSLADAVERAQAATVRLRVYDDVGHGAGTGTIIDRHGEEALVVTCGHLFRDTQGKGRIEVDLFVGGQSRTVAGQLIDYDANDRDIALVAIRPQVDVTPVQVIGAGELPKTGDTVFSFGCDRGDDPSRRDTRITGVNKYNQHKQASNLEISGAPIDGRSGGGLFDTQGRLVGVCNAADYKGDVGIYAGPGSIHWQLDRIQLSHLYAPNGSPATPATADPMRLASLDSTSRDLTGPLKSDDSDMGLSMASTPMSGTASAAPTAGLPLALSQQDSEVIVIVRDRTNPAGSPRVLTLNQPSPELLHMLESQSLR